MKTHKIFINGKWTASKSRKTFQNINPANERVISRFQLCDEEDTRKAINAAKAAFTKWKKVPAPKRAEVLLKAAQIMRKDKERLARVLTTEMGKIIEEARGDVQEAIDMLEFMAGEGRRMLGHTTPSELRNKFACSVRVPIGVCGLITPWNFPFAIPSWKIAPALIFGNTVVFKPASDTPLTATEFVRVFEKAGLPKGVLNLVTGPGGTVGSEIVENKNVDMISFTGSREVGYSVARNAGLKKVGLELGGKNGIIVMDDADLNLALGGTLFGAFGTTGQRCTACSRVIVHRKVKRKFQKMLVNRIKKLRIGNGLLPSTDVGPLINRSAQKKVHMYTGIGKEEGAKLVIGGDILNKKGFFYKPTLFTNVSTDMRIAQEEIFGPTLSIIEVKNLDEAIDVMNGITYGLSSAIYTKDVNRAFRAIEDIEAGLVYVNSSTIGSEVHLPFGGVKETGNGTREGGLSAIHEFTEEKTVYVDYSGRLQKAQIDTPKMK